MDDVAPAGQEHTRRLTAASLLATLGVVYGDIGTSPLYAFKASLNQFAESDIGQAEVLGVLSLLFWALVLIVTVKYVLIIMRADNGGEGGILALTVLAQRVTQSIRLKWALGLIGIAGAALLFGDGLITPAISVLSAIEGLEVSLPQAKPFVLPISAIVIVLLFTFQYRGTTAVGRVLGPIMVIWFVTISVLGAVQLIGNPFVLAALSPHYGVALCLHHGWLAFLVLGSVVLVVTGAEALYADMGHFGPRPIRLNWLYFVLPCLVLNYFGQGALVLVDPKAIKNPFFLMGPEWLRLPLVLLATLATIIASQAMISGAYSITRQCMQLGILPRMMVRHTSQAEEGQIYLPQVNAALLVGVLILVFAFRSSHALAAAYGIAVTGTFLCTCVLASVVFRRQFQWSRIAAFGIFGFFFLLDGTFFASNTVKVMEGGWVPLLLGLVLMGVMTTWQQGRNLLLARHAKESLPLASFVERLPRSRIIRVPGTAAFLTRYPDSVPQALLHNLKHNKVLHEHVLLVTVLTTHVPEEPLSRRAKVEQLANGINRVSLRYGFMESPNLPHALGQLTGVGNFNPMAVSYFLGRETLVPTADTRLPFWRLWLFLLIARNTVSAAEFFRIPSDRAVELGARISI
jgi:KUP system potassium uptake protein